MQSIDPIFSIILSFPTPNKPVSLGLYACGADGSSAGRLPAPQEDVYNHQELLEPSRQANEFAPTKSRNSPKRIGVQPAKAGFVIVAAISNRQV